ncbi:MAG: hypothetical protein GF408_07175 [Candidatus Omnitrophica bacterium]|nr:hypothetical protein [Candidatus Omnitrophota bacterium]
MNKEFHVSFRVPADMMKFQEEIISEIQENTSRKVTYSRFFRAQLDILRRDKKIRKDIVQRIAKIVDSQ